MKYTEQKAKVKIFFWPFIYKEISGGLENFSMTVPLQGRFFNPRVHSSCKLLSLYEQSLSIRQRALNCYYHILRK